MQNELKNAEVADSTYQGENHRKENGARVGCVIPHKSHKSLVFCLQLQHPLIYSVTTELDRTRLFHGISLATNTEFSLLEIDVFDNPDGIGVTGFCAD